MRPDRARHLAAWRCLRGHVFLYRHRACPDCGGTLHATHIRPDAVLVSVTTVRVNPTGFPYRLGIARAAGGATTLCLVEGAVRGTGHDRVRLVVRGGRYHALGARVRTTPRNPAPPATP